MSLVQDFKKFVMRGNVLDMAVGVIIGAAFGKIISTLVDKVMMPVIGQLTSGVDFKELYVVLDSGAYDTLVAKVPEQALKLADVTAAGIPVIAYGEFINAVINFFIVALSVFVMIKVVASLQRKEEAAPVAPPGPTKDQELLMEIRDLLKK